MITSDVENYPGYPDGIMGPEMMADFRRQAERFGAEFVTDDVTKVDFSERPFRVWVEDDEYRAQAVIVATGASARWLGLESEQRLQGRGVSACATCDGAFFKEQADRRRRRRRLRDRGGAVPDALRLEGHARPPARRVPRRRRSWSTARAQQREDRVLTTPYVVEEILGDRMRHRRPAARHRDGRAPRDRGRRLLRRDRPRPEHEALRRPARPRRERLPAHEARLDRDEHPRRVRGRRRPGSHLPPGGHGRRLRLHGRARRRALPRRARRPPGTAPHRPRAETDAASTAPGVG